MNPVYQTSPAGCAPTVLDIVGTKDRKNASPFRGRLQSLRNYSKFCTCSRICSMATFISTAIALSSCSADFEPRVLASR